MRAACHDQAAGVYSRLSAGSETRWLESGNMDWDVNLEQRKKLIHVPGGSVELSNGSILLGPASDLGLLEGTPDAEYHYSVQTHKSTVSDVLKLPGDFTVEFWMRCQDHLFLSAMGIQ